MPVSSGSEINTKPGSVRYLRLQEFGLLCNCLFAVFGNYQTRYDNPALYLYWLL